MVPFWNWSGMETWDGMETDIGSRVLAVGWLAAAEGAPMLWGGAKSAEDVEGGRLLSLPPASGGELEECVSLKP